MEANGSATHKGLETSALRISERRAVYDPSSIGKYV